MNVEITKFLASAKGKRFVKQAQETMSAQRARDQQHTKMALITNRAHPDYKNGTNYES